MTEPQISEDEKKLYFRDFLAYYSYEIGHDGPTTDKDGQHLLVLSYDNLDHVCNAMFDPDGNKKCMSWKHIDDIEDDGVKSLVSDSPKNITVVQALINGIEDSVFRISSFELFAKVRLPFVMKNKYNQDMTVPLTMHEKQLVKDGLIIDFYPIANTQTLELIITNQDQRKNIVSRVVSMIYESIAIEKKEHQVNHALLVKFTDGDHELIAASIGYIKSGSYQLVSIDSLKNESYYESIKSVAKPVIVISLEPKSENAISCAILSTEE